MNDEKDDYSLMMNKNAEEDEKLQNPRAHISERISNKIYYPSAILLFIFQMLLSYLIDDITIIIGFFTAIAESSVNFILPGLFFILSSRMTNKKINIFVLIGAYFYVALGISLFFYANYKNIQKI